MSIRTDNQIKLNDGRSLGYAEYGDPKGKPIMCFHGCPSSRFESNLPAIDDAATRLHARIIVPDRPGIGLSDFKPYTIISWPDIVSEFADKLGLDRFAVMGGSSGGKFAAACAWKIPQRLTVTNIISTRCPVDLPGAPEITDKLYRQSNTLANKAPWLLRLILWRMARGIRKNPAVVVTGFSESAPDKETTSRPDVKRMFEQMVLEAFRQGTRGVAYDFMLQARPWGFALQEIQTTVYVLHGEMDKLVPVEDGRIIAGTIPNVQFKLFPNDGHTLVLNHAEDIIGTLVRY